MIKLDDFGKKVGVAVGNGIGWCIEHPYISTIVGVEALYITGVVVGAKYGVRVGRDQGFSECLTMFNKINSEATEGLIAQGLANGICGIV